MKNTILLPIFLIFLIGIASAAVDLVTPATSNNYSTSFTFMATFTNGSEVTDPVDADSTLWCNYSGTFHEMTWTSFSYNETAVIATVALTSAMDDTGIMCNVTLGNSTTNSSDATGNTEITFDSTDPVPTTSRSSYDIEPGTLITLGCSCSDAIDSYVTTTRTLNKAAGGTVSGTSASQTFSGANTMSEGQYTYDCTCTDAAGNTNTKTVKFMVSSDLMPLEEEVTPVTTKVKKVFILIGGFLILFIIILVAIITTSGKKKRR